MPKALPSTVLVTGATGYIGATLVRRLLADGCHVIALDNLQRGHRAHLPAGLPLVEGDVRDADAVRAALRQFARPPEACIHLAGLIQVGESTRFPEMYRDINAVGTQVVADVCLDFGVPALVMASSAAVLRPLTEGTGRLDEDAPVGPESPYGTSKLSGERTLHAAAQTARMSTVALRLFNVAAAAYGLAERHEPETHLIPLALRAATGELPPLQVYGVDLPTPDGTCLRDYVHVLDVVEAFVRAARLALHQTAAGECEFQVIHVGSGVGRSVREVMAACEQVLARPVPFVPHPRRPGDVPALVADPRKLARLLDIHPDPDILRMARDAALALGLLAG